MTQAMNGFRAYKHRLLTINKYLQMRYTTYIFVLRFIYADLSASAKQAPKCNTQRLISISTKLCLNMQYLCLKLRIYIASLLFLPVFISLWFIPLES